MAEVGKTSAPSDIHRLCEDLIRRAALYGIAAGHADLDRECAGKFDGPTITLNATYDPTERSFYLAHAIGSIAEWTIQFEESRQVFRELRRAKQAAEAMGAALEHAVRRYLEFETRTWERAVWLLEDLRHERWVGPFTNFGRADMESMRIFHTTGQAPPWREFFSAWNEEVLSGRRKIEPFPGRPIPEFRAITIPKQEILQESD